MIRLGALIAPTVMGSKRLVIKATPSSEQTGYTHDNDNSLDLPSAAVHEKFDARDETRVIRGEKQCRLGDLCGLADTPDGDGGHNPRNNVRRLLTHQRSLGRTRTQHIGADATIFELHGPSA